MKVIRFSGLCMLTVLLVLEAITAAARAEVSGSVEWWSQTVGAKKISEIAKVMEEGGSPQWPEVRSIRQAQDDESVAEIALVDALHEKLKQSFETDEASVENVRAYVAISARLQASGGYSNILLAECFDRIVLFRITGWLVEKEQPMEEVRALYDAWKVPGATDPKTWLLRFQDDDPTVKAVRNNFENIKPGMLFGPNIIGMQPLSLDAAQRENQTFTKLMKQPSVLLLMSRFAETEFAKTVCVRGFISFSEKGGGVEELDGKDIRAFKRRMGDDVYDFSYLPFSHKRLSVSDVEFAYEIHSDPRTRASLLDPSLK